MKKTLSVRPEQARSLLTLLSEAKEADKRFLVAANSVLAGLVNGGKIENIAEDGTVTLEVPEDD